MHRISGPIRNQTKTQTDHFACAETQNLDPALWFKVHRNEESATTVMCVII